MHPRATDSSTRPYGTRIEPVEAPKRLLRRRTAMGVQRKFSRRPSSSSSARRHGREGAGTQTTNTTHQEEVIWGHEEVVAKKRKQQGRTTLRYCGVRLWVSSPIHSKLTFSSQIDQCTFASIHSSSVSTGLLALGRVIISARSGTASPMRSCAAYSICFMAKGTQEKRIHCTYTFAR